LGDTDDNDVVDQWNPSPDVELRLYRCTRSLPGVPAGMRSGNRFVGNRWSMPSGQEAAPLMTRLMTAIRAASATGDDA
jgi:hypothetical protein